MQVITTHLNADFDALASMMAAKKLYPEARAVFSGSQERNLREFFLHSTLYLMEFDKAKNIPLDEVDHLILVDVSSADRIGRFGEIVDRPGLKLHIYDHHRRVEGGLSGELEVRDDVGAATTLLIELLQQRGISLTPAEATVMAMGIYEETGSLLFSSTTPRDMMAAAWLLSQQADLNVVADVINHPLSAEQISFLNELVRSVKTYHRGGLKITIAAASSEVYIQDIAVLAHKLRDMEGSDSVFILASLEDRIHLVARSRVPEIDAGRILKKLGGGGHASAAAGIAKELSLAQAEEHLMVEIDAHVLPVKSVKEIMTTPVITIKPGASLKEAGDAMTRYNVNVLPVVDKKGLQGLISREVVQKAQFHDLGHAPVSQYMTTDLLTASPDMPVPEIETAMVEHNQRFFAVVDEGRVVGAITRTDILRSLHDRVVRRPFPADSEAVDFSSRGVQSLLREKLPSDILDILKTAGRLAQEMGFSAYLVGGFVRDLLLSYDNLDIDIVVEGDGIAFAQKLAARYHGRVKAHQKFGTAVIQLPDGKKFDIATARTEYYERPGALPTVELGSIKKDLYRRDFTINTLAIKLDERDFGILIDFFGGRRDIKEKSIRILHNLSFVEDPTRVFRAIRFEQRFNFRISKHTQSLIRNAVSMDLFHRLSGGRLYTELRLIFTEAEPIKSVRRMGELGLLRFIHPDIAVSRKLTELLKSTAEVVAWYRLQYFEEEVELWVLYLMALLEPLSREGVEEVIRRLAVPARVSMLLLSQKDHAETVARTICRPGRLKPSTVYHVLHPLSVEVLLNAMARCRDEEGKRRVSSFLTSLRSVKPAITGKDLQKLGVKEGPSYRDILKKLLDARLDGEVVDKEGELSLVERFLARSKKK
ncbi:MAG: CBS domain-containing protein [Nitrospirota bacterium]|nr:CBS domain-containing protein [Nitrospirota bacterium]